MDIQTLDGSPRNERGGQVSHLLLTAGQFGSLQLSVTWVECQPGSQRGRPPRMRSAPSATSNWCTCRRPHRRQRPRAARARRTPAAMLASLR